MELKTVQLVEVTKKGQPVVIRDVPAKVCPNCGEQVFAKPVAEGLLAILSGEGEPEGTVTLELPLYTLSSVNERCGQC